MASGNAPAANLYLRAGFGIERAGETTFTDASCASTSPAALYGCGLGGDGAPLRSIGELAKGPAFEVGVGYTASPALRFELAGGYRPQRGFQGEANFLEPGRQQSVGTDVSTLSAMLAAYVELDALGVPRIGPFSPFIGAGIGVVRTRTATTTMSFPKTTTIVPGGGWTGTTWMLTAGASVAVDARTTLDIAWRHTDLGEARTGRGEGRVVWRDGRREPLPLDLAPTHARLRTQGLQVSLRYAF